MINARDGYEWVVRLQDGEDLGDALRSLRVNSALILTGIGMVRDIKLAFWNGNEYQIHGYPNPCELVSLQGNLALDQSNEKIAHIHLSIAGDDLAVHGGHLIQATVHNTVEIGLLPLSRVALDRRPESNGLVGLFPRANQPRMD